MGCAVDCTKSACYKEPLCYHLYCTPEGGSCSGFIDSSSTVGLGVYFFNKDFNWLVIVTNRPTSTPYLYVVIYLKKKRWCVETFLSRKEVLHFWGWIRHLIILGKRYLCADNLWSWLKLAWAKETCVTGDRFWAGAVWKLNFFFLSKIVRKVKDIFKMWEFRSVAKPHRWNESWQSKTCWFFLCSFAGHKYISACYHFLRLW